MNIRILVGMLLLTGCGSPTQDERRTDVLDIQDPKEEVEIVAAEPVAFILEYPSPPPADSGQFHAAIEDLSKRLTDEGISHNTQGFLGNHFFVQGDPRPAMRVLQEYSKTSPYKLSFVPEPDGEQSETSKSSSAAELKSKGG